jgi:hypothetical protein
MTWAYPPLIGLCYLQASICTQSYPCKDL